MYTNSYVFKYAAILVTLVAAILTAAAVLLKPAQDRNIIIKGDQVWQEPWHWAT